MAHFSIRKVFFPSLFLSFFFSWSLFLLQYFSLSILYMNYMIDHKLQHRLNDALKKTFDLIVFVLFNGFHFCFVLFSLVSSLNCLLLFSLLFVFYLHTSIVRQRLSTFRWPNFLSPIINSSHKQLNFYAMSITAEH